MIWSLEDQSSAARQRAQRAVGLSLGMASPLWFAFGAAASAGATWWWMTRWAKAVNLEAMAPASDAIEPILAAIETPAATEQIAEPNFVREAARAATSIEPSAQIEHEVHREHESRKVAPVKHAASKPISEPDDLTRLVGIGPKLADALAERGVTRFAELAAWTTDDLAIVDAALSLKGRAVRDAWVAQAKRFAAASVH